MSKKSSKSSRKSTALGATTRKNPRVRPKKRESQPPKPDSHNRWEKLYDYIGKILAVVLYQLVISVSKHGS